ncbi:thioredoxin domain-containing protein [Candidatus Woesearchaeota archaeon]|nr:thioredoxin domain-containing protein [Candidatus Woesearchaeota archaeon]
MKKRKKHSILLKKKKSTLDTYKIATMVLGVLLIISLYTNGFNFGTNSVSGLQKSVEKLSETTSNDALRTELEGFQTTLEEYREVEEVKEETKKTPSGGVGEKVKLDFYVMSQCPYGTQAEDAIYPVLQKIGGDVDFNVDFISTDLGGGQFRSLHGEPETQGNIVQLCAAKYNPEAYMDMIICQNKNAKAIPGNWERCAEQNDLDVDKIKACFEGEEGKTLLSESVKKAQAVNARGSPTIYLNDELYQGGRTERDFLVAICNAYSGNRPAECDDIPVPQEVALTIVTDKNCNNCDTSQLLGALKRMFPGLKTTTVDVSSSSGEDLIDEFNIELVPTYIFDEQVAEEEAYTSNPQLAAVFEKIGSSYKLKDEVTGAKYYISEEKRAELHESIGVVKGDNRPQIDFYVMSYCPYGNQAEEAIKLVFDELKDYADFNPKYVIYNQGNGCYEDDGVQLCSLHGGPEIHQNVRELCVKDEYGIDAWFTFALEMNTACTSQNADTCWEAVAQGLGYDTAKISACEDAKGVEYSKADYDLNVQLGVRGSPTVFIDGEEYSGSRTAEGYMASLCAAFEEPPAPCDNIQVTTPSTAAAPSTGQC